MNYFNDCKVSYNILDMQIYKKEKGTQSSTFIRLFDASQRRKTQ
jgi:hypothetical protein